MYEIEQRQNIRQIPRYNKAIASVWCLIWTYQLQFNHQLNYSLCMYVINIVVTLVVLRERSREITSWIHNLVWLMRASESPMAKYTT